MDADVRILPAALAILLLAAGPAAAQRTVERCEQQCFPSDDDVNGQAIVENGAVNVLLYAHPTDLIGRISMMTQMPDPLVDARLDGAFLTPTVITDTGTAADVNFATGDFEFAPARGYLRIVDGRETCMCGMPLGPVEMGPGPITLYGYLSVDAGSQETSVQAGFIGPIRVVASWTRIADSEEVIVAQGASEAFTIQRLPGDSSMVEVRIPLANPGVGLMECTRPAGPGSCPLRVRIEQLATEDARATQRDWRFRSGPDHLWHLVVPVVQPLRTVTVDARMFDQSLIVDWRVENVFGPEDADESSMNLKVRDGDRLVWAGPATKWFGRFDHDAYTRPARLQWVVPKILLGDASAATALELSAMNSQGTYRLTASLPLPPDPADSARDIPAPDLALLAGLAALVALGRRRH